MAEPSMRGAGALALSVGLHTALLVLVGSLASHPASLEQDPLRDLASRPREREKAEQKQVDARARGVVVAHVLLGPRHPLDHGVDRLEVARVGRQGDRRVTPESPVNLPVCAQVVLDVAGALHRLRVDVPSNSLNSSP